MHALRRKHIIILKNYKAPVLYTNDAHGRVTSRACQSQGEGILSWPRPQTIGACRSIRLPGTHTVCGDRYYQVIYSHIATTKQRRISFGVSLLVLLALLAFDAARQGTARHSRIRATCVSWRGLLQRRQEVFVRACRLWIGNASHCCLERNTTAAISHINIVAQWRAMCLEISPSS
jgi:hypothetical protein